MSDFRGKRRTIKADHRDLSKELKSNEHHQSARHGSSGYLTQNNAPDSNLRAVFRQIIS